MMLRIFWDRVLRIVVAGVAVLLCAGAVVVAVLCAGTVSPMP